MNTRGCPTNCRRTPKQGQDFDPKRHCRKCFLYDTNPEWKVYVDTSPPLAIEIPEPPPLVELKDGPGWFTRLVNFSKASVAHAWAGLPQAPDAVAQQRIALCLVCEYIRKKDGVCLHPRCGCPTGRKARWADQACPLEKW